MRWHLPSPFAGCNIWFWLKCSQACAAKEKSHETFCLLPIQDLSVRSPESGVVRSSRRTHNECQPKPERRAAQKKKKKKQKMHYNAACQPTWTWANASRSRPSILLGLHLSYVTNRPAQQPRMRGNRFTDNPKTGSEYVMFSPIDFIDWLLIPE